VHNKKTACYDQLTTKGYRSLSLFEKFIFGQILAFFVGALTKRPGNYFFDIFQLFFEKFSKI